jgi:HlyD family secretion protein
MTTATQTPRWGVGRGRWLGAGIALIIVGIIAALVVNSFQAQAAPLGATTVSVARGSIMARVAGNGTVAATQTLDLPFEASGSVTDVLVKEGDVVKAGQALARLNTRTLQLEVENAQANLASAYARLEQSKAGNATPEDIAAAEASVKNAQAQLQRTQTGNITAADIASAQASVRSAEAQLRKAQTGNATAADIASAEAQLRSAEAQLQKAQRGPTPDQVSSAQASLQQAQQNYDKTVATASTNKTSAYQSMVQASDSVRLAQESYSTAYWNDQQAQNGINPQTGRRFEDDKLDEDVQQRQYAEALRNAELQLRQAESRLEQAKLTHEQAQRQETADVANAQTQVDNARVQLEELLKGPKTEDVAVAQASVDQARANLQKLREGGTPADVAIAQASLDQARANLQKLRQGGTQADITASQATVEQSQANLNKLTAPATETDLNIQQASVAQAEQSLKQAKLNLEHATLKAPFAGVVTEVNIVPGSIVTSATPALRIVDRSTLHVDLRLSEYDVARVQLDQPVTLTIDSLDNWQTEGEVSYIAPVADTTNDVVTYKVQVTFPDNEPRVKVGMTADLEIQVAQKDNVLLVPNTALLPKGSGHVVQVSNADGTTREVDVQIGLTDGVQTEIVSGLDEGQQIVAVPQDLTPTNRGGLFGN